MLSQSPDARERACFEIPAASFAECGSASDLIAEALAEHRAVFIPRLDTPICLDRPIVLASGMRLRVHPETALRLKAGLGGCLLRNAHLPDGCDGPMTVGSRDHDILVEGGIWEDVPRLGRTNDPDPVMRRFLANGLLLGVLFFCGADRVEIRNLTVRRSEVYAILLSGCDDFTVRGISFDGQKKDGVHVNGPSARGLIDDVHGLCGDDIVALNAWDWKTSAVSFGPIRDISVKRVRCERGEIRLLPGRKTYADGLQVDCPVENCAFQDIEGVYTFKMYQQPNCHNAELPVPDRSDIPGAITGITFDGVRLGRAAEEGFGEIRPEGLFEMGADCRHILIRNVSLAFPASVYAARGGALVTVGPKSSAWTRGFADPAKWVELFEPDLICEAEDIRFDSVRFDGLLCRDEALLIRARRLSVNEDYPRTRPRGGTGYGLVRGVAIEGMTI